MDIALWAVAIALAGFLLINGIAKLVRPIDALRTAMPWTEDFSGGAVKLIGIIEIAAAAGLVLPGLTGIGTGLVVLAAVGVMVLMVLAASVHLRRREPSVVVINAVVLVAAGFVAWGRWVEAPF